MKIWTEPIAEVVGVMTFRPSKTLPVDWVEQDPPLPPNHQERLVEFGGRLCYLSLSNPARKTNKEYIHRLLSEKHGSVFRHAKVSIVVQGISRSLSHEMVRHDAGVDVSQLSQRYVDRFDAVVPPAVLQLGEKSRSYAEWKSGVDSDVIHYACLIEALKADGIKGKELKEAARSLLPNCAETKMLVTVNAQAWRHIITQRSAKGADREIQRLMLKILPMIREELPSTFQDFNLEGAPEFVKV